LNTANWRQRRATILVVVTSFLAIYVLTWMLPRVFEPWNAQVMDMLFRWRSTSSRFQPTYDPTVVHIDLNNSSIQQLDNFYLNRSHFARVLGNLNRLGVASQFYDFIFAAKSNERDDNALIEGTRTAGNVYYGMAFSLHNQSTTTPKAGRTGAKQREINGFLESQRWMVTVEGDPQSLYVGVDPLTTFVALASAARGLGFLTIEPDQDGVFRRVPLLVRYADGYFPSLPFRIVCDYLAVSPERILVRPGKEIVLSGACRPGGLPHDVHIPIDDRGNMLVNFVGPWERMKHWTFAEIYRLGDDREELEMWREDLTGKIVVISDVSTGAADVRPVPTDASYPLSGLHANVLNTILTERLLRELPLWNTLGVEVLLVVLLLMLSLYCSSRVFLLGNVLLVTGYLAVVAGMFLGSGIMLRVVQPLTAVAAAAVIVTAHRYLNEARQKEVLRRSFEAYFPPSVVRKIMAHPETIVSGGQKKELTILFSDIKNFTQHSANLSPDQIQKALNEYFEAMVEIVFRHRGTVDKYIGDGLMVFFGDPEPLPDHALQCVLAAIDMQRQTRKLYHRWQREGGFPIEIRVGINTGWVVVGNMGSSRQFSYTVLGAAVNLAQRLESNAPVGGILISERTRQLIEGKVSTRAMKSIRVKGLKEPVNAYEVVFDLEEGSATETLRTRLKSGSAG
jgi:adenylate cyclase